MVVIGLALLLAGAAPAPPWPVDPQSTWIAARIPAPANFTRVPVAEGSFAEWLRALPLLPGHPPVLLHDGRVKANQAAHAYVIDMDVGPKNLQQCADFVIRLFAEHQRARGQTDDLCFRFTSGDRIPWSRWSAGERPVVRRDRVSWARRARPDASYASFRGYLDALFEYAGTYSMARDLRRIRDPRRIEGGDVFIQGGFPGHAVVVLDVAEDARGERVFLLAQSFMPAQQPHVLTGPDGPWYRATGEGTLDTPEWRFDWKDVRRFGRSGCP